LTRGPPSMCGIIAVLRRMSRRAPPDPSVLDTAVTSATAAIDAGTGIAQLAAAADALADLDRQLRGVPGLCTLLAAPAAPQRCRERLQALDERIAAFEQGLDQRTAQSGLQSADDAVEARNQALVRLKDALWAVLQDRLPNADAVRDLAGDSLA